MRGATREADRAVSQTVRAQLKLRDMILSGRLPHGERITEVQAVDITGVSRTPVRLALVRLADEGLLQAIPTGGFLVKVFSERGIMESIALRGTLEGLAARFAAERGASAQALGALKACLAEIDQLLRQAPVSVEMFSAYVTLNARFHVLLSELAGSELLAREIDRASAMPFASPSAFVMAQSAIADSSPTLVVAQHQHHAVVEAIEGRDGARAESVMREHARLAASRLLTALGHRNDSTLLPALAKIAAASNA